MSEWLSEKGVKFVLSPKRGMGTAINPEIATPNTAIGQTHWLGTFVSPDVAECKKSTEIGGKEPVKATLTDVPSVSVDTEGNIIDMNNGEPYRKRIRIRKLTTKEYWRLMDFDDDDHDKASQFVSNTQLYKQAGNSIVVNCLVAIFGQMFEGKEEVYKDK